MFVMLCVTPRAHSNTKTCKYASDICQNADNNYTTGMCPLEVRDKAMITHLQLPLPVCKLRVLNADVERQQLTATNSTTYSARPKGSSEVW